jgi:Protein of unknown function (DUF2795)
MVSRVLEGYFDNVEFPATKIDLIDVTADSDAPQELVERLQQLKQERYDSREELEAELAGD